MLRKREIALSLFGVAFVTRKLFSTPLSTESFYILLALLILFLYAAVYHFIKRKDAINLVSYPTKFYLIIGGIAALIAIVTLLLV